jgi:hypothetical protein
MFDRKLGVGSEVYSSTALVRAAVSDSAVVKRRMGTQASMNRQVRYKFIDGRILRKALAAMELDSSPGKH